MLLIFITKCCYGLFSHFCDAALGLVDGRTWLSLANIPVFESTDQKINKKKCLAQILQASIMTLNYILCFFQSVLIQHCNF